MKHPQKFRDLIGPAATVGRVLDRIASRILSGDDEAIKAFMFYGPPGTAKTSLAVILASILSGCDSVDTIWDGSPLSVEMVSGKVVNVDLVRRWLGNRGIGNLFGEWQIKLIEEVDRVTPDAQDLLLNYLDKLPPKTAFICTSNMQIDLLQERFQTRLRTWKVMGAETDELAEFLMAKRQLDRQTAFQIAVASGGNIRGALLDAQSVLDAQAVAA